MVVMLVVQCVDHTARYWLTTPLEPSVNIDFGFIYLVLAGLVGGTLSTER